MGLSVNGFPTTYTPGSTLTFEVEITGAADLNAYNVGLELNSSKGTAGNDFYFEGSPSTYRPLAGTNRYVFDSGPAVSPVGFVATADKIASTNTALLNLSDFLYEGEFVSDASPDAMLATVVIGTTAGAGDLTLSFDGSVLELLAPNGQAVPAFSTLEANLNSFNPPPAVAVPEPASFTLLCAPMLAGIVIGLVGYGFRRRRQSRSLHLAGDTTHYIDDETDSQVDGPTILSLPSCWTKSARRAA